LEPQIAAGSLCEIGGALYEFASLESITGLSGIANSSQIYTRLTVSGASVTASGTITAPTWSDSKQGFYTGSDRVIGGMYKDASGNYTKKWFYEEKQGFWLKRYGDGTIEVLGAVTLTGGVTGAVAASGAISGASAAISGIITANGGNAKISNTPGAYTTATFPGGGGGTYVIPVGTYYAICYGSYCYLEIYSSVSWRMVNSSSTSEVSGCMIFSDGTNYRFRGALGTWGLIAI
jgi:hypothetical protein